MGQEQDGVAGLAVVPDASPAGGDPARCPRGTPVPITLGSVRARQGQGQAGGIWGSPWARGVGEQPRDGGGGAVQRGRCWLAAGACSALLLPGLDHKTPELELRAGRRGLHFPLI